MPDTAPRNPFFPLVAFASGLFVVTILAFIAATLGDPRAPVAAFIDRYAGWLMAGEVVVILLTGFAALFVDRRQSLRNSFSPKPPVAPSHDQENPGRGQPPPGRDQPA